MKTILKNLAKAVGVIIYFCIIIYANVNIQTDRLILDVKIFASVFLLLGIFTIERAYKNDDGRLAITGIELLILSMHSLSIFHIVNLLKCNLNYYMIGSGSIITIYYLIKGIGNSIKENKNKLNTVSDISEIVKKEEPVKKEAKKRNG